MKALALVSDLIFSSRITAEAKAAGAQVQILCKPEQLTEAQGDLLLVDLNLAGATQAAATWQQNTGHRTIGFVSHIDSATIASAREAGFEEIMPRSRFIRVLPQLLRAGSSI